MRALRFHTFGDPQQCLALEDLPTLQPGPGEARLRMRLRPILQVRGVYGREAEVPATAGLEGLGVVEAIGEGVTG